MSESKPLYLDIRIPLITIRIVLISTVLSLISFGVLLPISFLSFNYLYNQLIPSPTIYLPLSNYILNYDFDNIPPFLIIGNSLDPLYANQPNRKQENEEVFESFDFDLSYNFKFEFDAYCKDKHRLNYEPIMYKISIVSNNLIDQLSPYGIKPYIHKKFNLWPISNNIHQLKNSQVLVSSMNTIVLNCDTEKIEKYNELVKIGDLLPPIVSSWLLPPILNDYSPMNVKTQESIYKIDLFKDLRFKSYLTKENSRFFEKNNFNILLEFNKPNIVINPTNSRIVINIAWKGIKYYLFHFKILSYLLGVSALWFSSTLALVITVGITGWIDFARTSFQESDSIESDDDDYENDDDDDDSKSFNYSTVKKYQKPFIKKETSIKQEIPNE